MAEITPKTLLGLQEVQRFLVSREKDPQAVKTQGYGAFLFTQANAWIPSLDRPGFKRLTEQENEVSSNTRKVNLIEILFPSEEKAEQVRQKLLDMQREYLIELGDAVIVVKQPDGRIKLNQLFNPTASGAVPGAFWGALIGMIFLMPLAGAAIGAASGALAGTVTRAGISERFIRDAGESLQNLKSGGNAALFLLVRQMTTDKVLAALQGEGGTVIRTSFDETQEEALRTALAGAAPPGTVSAR
jgi:uncharacterized membrane protein